MALYNSTDGGQSWTTHQITTTRGNGFAVAIDSDNDDIIYVGGYFYDNQIYRGALFKTIDGGDNWTDITGMISGYVYAIAVDPVSASTIYVGTMSGVYKSTDSGSSWIQPSRNFDVNCIKINPSSPNEIFAAGSDGVYLSDDGGTTWTDFNDGLLTPEILSLDMNVAGGFLYAGSSNGSAYKNNLLNQYSLLIQATGGGTTDPEPDSYYHSAGTEVTIEAIPNTNWEFSQWAGDVPQGHENDNPLTLTMDSDKSITANFTQLKCTLTLSATSGGTTNPLPGTYTYDIRTEVTITATPNSGYEFSGWSGDASGTDNPLTLTLDTDKSITANFTAIITDDDGDGDDSGGKKKCFIATAACDSPSHLYVKVLRDFRDSYLLTSKFGQKLVDLYYKHSPPWADLISKHRVLRVIVRINLLPLVILSFSTLHLGPLPTFFILLLMLILPIHISHFYQKKQKLPNQD